MQKDDCQLRICVYLHFVLETLAVALNSVVPEVEVFCDFLPVHSLTQKLEDFVFAHGKVVLLHQERVWRKRFSQLMHCNQMNRNPTAHHIADRR